MNIAMLPLLFVALLIWAGVFVFLLGIERRVGDLERQTSEMERREGERLL